MNEWWTAAVYVVAGVVVGAGLGAFVRGFLGRSKRREPLRQVARPTSALVFWLFVAAGLVAAVASTSPATLDPIPSDILAWLPRVGVAGLILIAGYVLGTLAAAAVNRTAVRATGRRQPVAEAATRFAVIGAATVLALSQLGIDTTILNILVAAVAFGTAFALAGVAITGGRHIARSVAAGKAVADLVEPGRRITLGGYTGPIVKITATHVVIALDDGSQAVLPLSESDHAPLLIHDTTAQTRD